jgi:hypothetical protein
MPRQNRTASKDQSVGGEDFGFENISGSDSDDNDPPIPAMHIVITGSVAQAVNNPDSIAKKSLKGAQDVWHFFVKADGFSVCQVCKYVTCL